jgi:hypothetical protein
MAHNIGIDIGVLGPTLARRLTFAAGFAGVCFLALLMAGVGQSVVRMPPARPVASTDPAQAAHCSQYIELARKNFGAEWKRRLDPRDTLCAEQVQQAWERDWRPREETPPEPVLQPKIVASAARSSKIAPPEAEPAQRSKTYALAAVTDANVSAAKRVGQDTSAAEPAGHDASAVKPARQDARAAKPARQETSTAGSSDQGASVADPAGQEDAADSDYAGEYDHPSTAAFEDADQDETVADEHAPDGHASSASDDADDETRTLNSEQLGHRSGHDDDMQGPPYDDSEVDEYDDIGDSEDP